MGEENKIGGLPTEAAENSLCLTHSQADGATFCGVNIMPAQPGTDAIAKRVSHPWNDTFEDEVSWSTVELNREPADDVASVPED